MMMKFSLSILTAIFPSGPGLAGTRMSDNDETIGLLGK